MSRVKGRVNATHIHLTRNELSSSFGTNKMIYVEEIPESVVRADGYQCAGCGHLYLHDNVSECDCTVGTYKFRRCEVIIIPCED